VYLLTPRPPLLSLPAPQKATEPLCDAEKGAGVVVTFAYMPARTTESGVSTAIVASPDMRTCRPARMRP
jgi:hypothetical protein